MKTTRKYPALGVLFKGEMVLTIQDGRKTQTRRIVKPQPIDDTVNSGYVFSGDHKNAYKNDALHQPWQERFVELAPIQVGDILYVKETWQPFDGTFSHHVFRADARTIPGVPGLWWRNENGVDLPCEPKWKSALFMPYQAARIFLKVTNVRIERLQDISEADAWAEGCKRGDPTDNGSFFPAEEPDPSGTGDRGWDSAEDWYADLWEQINGPGLWEANPYVWVYTFERTEKPAQP